MRSSDELPHEVILAIEHVLEVGDYSAVDVLNEFFPNEGSLAQVESVQARLVESQNVIRREIESLQLELQRDQDPNRMQLIQEMISDLFGQMSRIREKASESEAVVRNITKDIQVLDLAKKNLILSMTTLKRLHMLVNALTQLDDLVRERKYAEVAQTLGAVKEISVSFKSFTQITRISQILKQVLEVQSETRRQIDGEFDAFYLQDPSKPVKPALIADACLVVDALGPDIRSQIIDRHVVLELKEYRRIFRSTDEAGQLDNISRRFAWFKRLLQSHEIEQGRVFPGDWRVGWHLLAKFAEITRDDMTSLLSKAGSSLTVKSLLDNLQITLDFEAAMSKKWVTSFDAMLVATASPKSRPPKSISSAFEPHMGVFVQAQDRALSDMLAPHRPNKQGRISSRPSIESKTASEDGGDDPLASSSTVLPSSTELFYFYGQSLEQCAKLSTGQPLFDLCTLHKKWLRIYAEEVLVASAKRSTVPLRQSTETRFGQKELRHACLLINTADYCQTTALELEENICSKINEEFKEKVTLQAERDLFVNVVSTAIVALLRELDSACEPAFAAMSRTIWSNVNQVSGQSSYTEELITAVAQIIEIVKPLIEQKKYLRNFFDKAYNLVLAKFTAALVKSRPLKEIGAEQLLIDLQVIKAYLLKLPGEDLTTASYTRGLNKSTTRMEALLKVIVTPVDPPEGFILNYTLLIGDSSFSNFQKILDLKGTPKLEQNNLLDSFLTVTSTKDELESTSFLTALDMDPTGALVSLASPGGSRVSLPLGMNMMSDTAYTGLATPPLQNETGPEKREVFSDFRRLMSFGLRRDSQPPS